MSYIYSQIITMIPMIRRREQNTFQSDDEIKFSSCDSLSGSTSRFLVLLPDFWFHFSISGSAFRVLVLLVGSSVFWTTCFEDSFIDVVVNPMILVHTTSASILLLTVLNLQLMLMGIETWRRERRNSTLSFLSTNFCSLQAITTVLQTNPILCLLLHSISCEWTSVVTY